MKNQQPEIYHSDPDILGGVPVFTGTRVPVESLFHYLAKGKSIEEFREDFPSVLQEQGEGLLEQLGRELETAA